MLTIQGLKALRVRWHARQEDVALAAGCTKQTVCLTEKGKLKLTPKLAAAYKVAIGRKRRELRQLLKGGSDGRREKD
jgi:DNA-binding XRE family transcriptional regulator